MKVGSLLLKGLSKIVGRRGGNCLNCHVHDLSINASSFQTQIPQNGKTSARFPKSKFFPAFITSGGIFQ